VKRKNPQKHRKKTSDPQRHHMVEFATQFRGIHPGDHHGIARRQKRRMFPSETQESTKTFGKTRSDPQRHHMVEFAHSFEESTLETTTASQGAKHHEFSE
jgi:hypothetical protein